MGGFMSDSTTQTSGTGGPEDSTSGTTHPSDAALWGPVTLPLSESELTVIANAVAKLKASRRSASTSITPPMALLPGPHVSLTPPGSTQTVRADLGEIASRSAPLTPPGPTHAVTPTSGRIASLIDDVGITQTNIMLNCDALSAAADARLVAGEVLTNWGISDLDA